jgi:release factor glutamine methyltransferase
MQHQRSITPYERTQLLRHNKSEAELLAADETPVEYVTGIVPFADLEFVVTPDTLIPRIETEGLVTHALELLAQHMSAWADSSPLLLADVGTGCGAIGITMSRTLFERGIPHLMYASDISASAVAVAQQNAERLLSAKNQAVNQFFASDLLDSYPNDVRFHCMIANLPYIPSDRIETLESSVKDYEPHLALDGGDSGLSLIERFLDQAPQHLIPGGVILLEVDYTHDATAFSEFSSRWDVHTFIDEFLRQRFVLLTLRVNR